MGWLYIWILLCHACTSFARRYCAMATPPWHEAYNYTWGEENKWLESSEAFIASTWQCRQIAFPIARFLGSGVLQARGERGGGAPLEGDRGRASGVKRGGFGGWGGLLGDSSDHRIIYFQPDLLQYKGRYLCRLNNHNAHTGAISFFRFFLRYFYRTHVHMGSDHWVAMYIHTRPFWNFVKT